MQKNLILTAAASAAILSLPACSQEPQTVNTYDAQAAALANAAPVELPPAITASKTYRCSDNSLYYVDFYNNNTAMIRRGSREATPTMLTAEGGNPPYAGEGNSVSGTGDQVTVNGQSCHT